MSLPAVHPAITSARPLCGAYVQVPRECCSCSHACFCKSDALQGEDHTAARYRTAAELSAAGGMAVVAGMAAAMDDAAARHAAAMDAAAAGIDSCAAATHFTRAQCGQFVGSFAKILVRRMVLHVWVHALDQHNDG